MSFSLFLISKNACPRIYYCSTHTLFQDQTRAANYDTPWQSLMVWWKRVMSTRLIASTPLQPPCICWETTKRHGLDAKIFYEQSLNRPLPLNYISPVLNLRNKRTPKSKFFLISIFVVGACSFCRRADLLDYSFQDEASCCRRHCRCRGFGCYCRCCECNDGQEIGQRQQLLMDNQ